MARLRDISVTMTLNAAPALASLGSLQTSFKKFETDVAGAGKQINKALGDVAKETEKVKASNAKAGKALTDDMIMAYKNVAKAQKAAIAAQQKESVAGDDQRKAAIQKRIQAELALDQAKLGKEKVLLKERLKDFKDNEEAKLKIVEASLAKQATLERSMANKGKALERAGRKEDSFLGMKHGDMERTENFMTTVQGVKAGNVGTAVGSLAGGMTGGFVGMGIDLATEAIGAMVKLGQEAKKTSEAVQILSNELNVDVKSGMMVNLTNQLFALDRPLGMTREGLVKVAIAVQEFTPPAQVAETTDAILKLSRVSGKSAEDLTGTFSRMTQGLGLSGKEVGDLVAAVGEDLKEMSGDAVGAVENLVPIVNKAKLSIGDSGQAAKESAGIFIALSKATGDTGRAAGTTEKFFKKFADVVSDPKLVQTVSSTLPQGMSLMDAGLQEGSISATKFLSYMGKMKEQGKDVGDVLGKDLGAKVAVELDAMNQAMAESGETFESLAENTLNATDFLAKQLDVGVTAAQRAEEERAQRLDDLSQRMGQHFEGLVSGSSEASAGVLQAVAESGGLIREISDGFEAMPTAVQAAFGPLGGIVIGALEPIQDFFVDSNLEAQRAVNTYKDLQKEAEGMTEFAQSMKGAASEEDFFAKLGDSAEKLETVLPGVTEQMELIRNNADLTEVEKLQMLEGVLDNISNIKAAEAIEAAGNAANQSVEALTDMMEDSTSMLADLLASAIRGLAGFATLGLSEFLGFGEDIGDAVKDAVDRSQGQIVADSEARMSELQARMSELRAEQGEGEGPSPELLSTAKELAAEAKNLKEAKVELNRLEDEATKHVLNTYEANKLAFGEEQARAMTAELLNEQLASQPEIMASVADKLAQVADGTATTEGLMAAINERKIEENALTSEGLQLAQQQGQELDEYIQAQLASNETEAQGNERKKQGLLAQKAQNTAIINQLNAQLDLIDAAIRGEVDRAKAAKQVAAIEAEISQIKAGEKKTSTSVVQDIAGGSLQAARAKVQKSISDLTAANANIDSAVASLGKKTGKSAGGAKKVAEAAEKEEKSNDARLKAQEDYDKKLAKIQEDRLDREAQRALKEEEARRNQLREEIGKAYELNKLRDQRLEAEKKYIEDISSFIKDFKSKISDQTGSHLDALLDTVKQGSSVGKQILDDVRKLFIQNAKTKEEDIALQAKLTADLNREADTRKTAIDSLITIFHERATKSNVLAPSERDERIKAVNDLYANYVKNADKSTEAFTTLLNNVKSLLGQPFEAMKKKYEIDTKKIETEKDDVKDKQAAADAVEGLNKQLKELAAKAEKANKAAASETKEVEVTSKKGKKTTKTVKKTQDEIQADADLAQKHYLDLDTKQKELDSAKAKLRQLDKMGASASAGVADAKKELDELFKALDETTKKVDESAKATDAFNKKLQEMSSADAIGKLSARDLSASLEGAAALITKTTDGLKGQTEALQAAIAGGDWQEANEAITKAMSQLAPEDLDKIKTHLQELFSTDKVEAMRKRLNELLNDPNTLASERGRLERQLEGLDALVERAGDLTKAEEKLNEERTKGAEIIVRANKTLENLQDSLSAVQSAQALITEKSREGLSNEEKVELENKKILRSLDEQVAALKAKQEARQELTKAEKEALEILERQRDVMIAAGLIKKEEATEQDEAARVKGIEDKAKAVMELVKGFERFADMVMDLPDQVTEIGTMFKLGDTAGGLKAAGDLTQKVGEALLNAPYPLNVAGAFLVMGGTITRIIGKIVDKIKGDKETQEDLAKRNAEAEARLLAIEQARNEANDNLTKLNDRQLDQAKEQLAAIRAIHDARLGESEAARKLADMSDRQLVNTIKEAKIRKELVDARLAQIEYEGQSQKLGASARAEQERLKAESINLNTTIENGNSELEYRTKLLQKQQEVLEQQLEIHQLLIRLGADEGKQLEATLKTTKAMLIDTISQLPDVRKAMEAFNPEKYKKPGLNWDFRAVRAELRNMSEDDLKKLMQSWLGLEGEQLSGVQEIIDSWLNASDAVDDYNDKIKEGTDAMKEHEEELARIVRERQKFLKTAREGGLTEAEKAALKEITDRAVAKYAENHPSATPEEIEKFRDTLPKYALGGLLEKDGPIFAHKGEFVVPASGVKLIGMPFLEGIRKGVNPLSLYKTPEAQALAANIINNNKSTSINSGGNTYNITISVQGGSNPALTAEMTRKELESFIKNVANNGIRTGEISTRRA